MHYLIWIRQAFINIYSKIFVNFGPMVNKEVASQFNLLAALMELHGENAFKTKSYLSAYQSLRKWDRPLTEMSQAEIAAIPGVGVSAAAKIRDLVTKGVMEPLENFIVRTPVGIQQLLSIKGMGPRKIRTIWDSLGVESPAELLYACNENRLVKLPGFGLKTQEDLCAKISYFLDSQHRYLYGVIENDLFQFEHKWNNTFPEFRLSWAGEVAKKSPVVSSIDCLITPAFNLSLLNKLDQIELVEQSSDHVFSIRYAERYTIRCTTCDPSKFTANWSRLTMSPALVEKLSSAIAGYNGDDMDLFFIKNGYPGLPIELLDYDDIENASPDLWTGLITESDIKGVVHNHSTYSDGIHTLEEMATHVRDMGFSYFGICDHSQSAFYANGMPPERVMDQMDEVDILNKKLAPFVIIKGIESDILNDGSLDYTPEILSRFELVVASIHSNLRMDEDKATARLIKAIENPYTHILGHPTSRLLLARPGYPVHHKKIIDACASNGVAMELNANPQRMEIDFRWLNYCQDKGVWVSINPDAHSRTQVGYLKYGVLTARKGALKKHNCLNALEYTGFKEWLEQKRKL